MSDDDELLRRFAEANCERAFTELVERRIGFVYSVALRKTRDAQRAEDAAQIVFVALAKNAAVLAQRTVLLGWLHHAARNAATDIVRAEISRAGRERVAQTMHDASAPDGPVTDWDQIRPVLDESLNELEPDDRDAVLLRFYEGRKYAEIGRTLRTTENTARMRVERALEKLQGSLVRRGIVSTSAAVSAALAQQGTAPVPAGLVESVARAVQPLLRVLPAQSPTLWKIIMQPKILLPVAVVAVVVSLTVVRPRAQPAQVASTQQTAAKEAIVPAPTSVGVAQAATPARSSSPRPVVQEMPAELVQERAIRNNLRSIGAARDAFLKFQNRLPESIEELVGPTKLMRELKPVRGEDYATVQLDSKLLSVQVPGGSLVTLTTDGPQRRGPPTREESATWETALASYLRSRPAGAAPRLPDTAPAAARRDGLEFAGVMAFGANHVFIVEDQTGVIQWVKLGQRVGAHVVAEYRADDETLILKNGEAVMPLKLRKAKPTPQPFAAELEIAYLALQEVLKREGWPASAMSIQKPQYLPTGHWFAFMYRVIEKTEQRIVPGEEIRISLKPDGTIDSYTNAGVREPRKN